MTFVGLTQKKKVSAPLVVPWKPHSYQKRSLRFMLKQCAAGLLLDPGLGKTSITLKAISVLKKSGIMRRALVIAPLRVCYQVWPKEIQKWADFKDLKMVVLHGKYKENALEEQADVYVVNPDALQWLFGKNRDGEFRFDKLDVDTLVIDESSKFKNTNTRRFKTLRDYLDRFRRRYILTGSPMPNGYLDLFGQIYILDQGRALGQYVTHYRSQFFQPAGYMGYEWKLQHGAEKRIQKAIKPLVLRLDAADYLHLPKLIENTIRVELPSEARNIYDAMEEEMIAELQGGKTVLARSAAVASNKCAQIANGGVYYEDNVSYKKVLDIKTMLEAITSGAAQTQRKTRFLHTEKVEALQDLIEELQGSPLLVAYEFEHDLEHIHKVISKNIPHIGGGVTPRQSEKIEEAWNAGSTPVLLGHPQSIAHGLNLQSGGCHHVAFFSVPWNREWYDQFIARVCRQGNKARHVTVHHFVSTATVDEAKMAALRHKGTQQAALLRALRLYIRERK